MNYVNLIGKMSSEPRFRTLPDGNKVAKFTLVTIEKTLDKKGDFIIKKDYHLMSAWGRWVKVIEKIKDHNVSIAVEGKITSRFYFENGKRKHLNEIEINDLLFIENSSYCKRNVA